MLPADRLFSVTGRPTRAEIDLDAFGDNLLLARKMGGEEREVMAVIKADAYGHGAGPLGRFAARRGAFCAGVATVAEAGQLREAGVKIPVIILGEVLPASAGAVVRYGCTQVLYSLTLAEALEREAGRKGRKVPVHLKIDTGMGRVGVSPREALPLALRLQAMPHLRLEGVLTHLAEADSLDAASTLRQVRDFSRVCRRLKKKIPTLRFFHVANSALLMRGEAVGNLVRPGIMLYGSPPAPGFPGEELLRPVMRLVTAVTYLKKVSAGKPLSYRGTHVTNRTSLIATLPIGYADGYSRRLSNRADVLIHGRRAPQVGNICMDMCLVDVTDVPGVKTGDEVVLMGQQGEERITADEIAGHMGTISYEVTCSVSARVPRFYTDGEGSGILG